MVGTESFMPSPLALASQAKEAFDALDHSTIKADIRAVKPGEAGRGSLT